MPERKVTGKKTMQKVMVETSTGMATSWVPVSAAAKGSSPSSMCRTIDSTTTIDWSINIPITSARPPRVIALKVAPEKYKPMMAARMARGRLTSTTIVERRRLRNKNTTRAPKPAPNNPSNCNDRSDWRT